MGHGKKENNKKIKVWKILDGTYKKPMGQYEVERLIAGIQQEIVLDELDIKTIQAIDDGILDWSGERVRSKRKPRTYIRKRS